ncbi:MAG: dTMP kinase, partial [Myxococcales bacterium]|nr:dTMP kinase [Myxococcales bacterium]
LSKYFERRGLPVHATREPSDGPIGVMLRQVLTGRLVVPGISGPRPPSWTNMALLFAADRVDHVEAEIVPNLMDGVTVLSDRYDYSSVAYQSLSAGGGRASLDWVRQINSHARRPDLVIVLDVPADVADKRRAGRSGRRELYEDPELQSRLVDFYGHIEQHFPEDRVVHVNAARDLEVVAADIVRAVETLRGEEPARQS